MSVRGLWNGATHAKCERVMCVVEGTRSAQIIEHALTVSNLDLPPQSIPLELVRRVKLEENVDLSAHRNAQPRILLGQDNWRLIETDELRQIKATGLVISRSLLGWSIHGYLEDKKEEACSLPVDAICCAKGTPVNSEILDLAELNALIKNHFELESLGVASTAANKIEEDRAMKILRETTRKVGKTWETGILWKSDNLPKLDTRTTALKRLRALERRLDRDSKFATLYYQEMNRLIDNGYARKVANAGKSPRERYVSHFGVENANKPGKVRLVFDAAEKTDGISMNDLLDTGPELLESLLGVLLRFRQHPFAVVADIKDMYLRVNVIEQDRAAHRFLYRGAERHREPSVYEMTCLIFGSKSSPCSALYVKNQNAERFAQMKPEAAKSIVKNSYMDDYLVSGKSVEEMRKLVRDVSLINSEANFVMHGWASNDSRIVKDVGSDKQLSSKQNASLCNREERVLGLYWDRDGDSLSFNVGLKKIRDDVMKGVVKPTKREFCSIIMSVYDPLGILSPFMLCAKLIMRDIWISGVGWDMKIRDEEFNAWKLWLTNLIEIKNCNIPRSFIPRGADYGRTQLHIFCDASQQAYAATAYLRIESRADKVHLSLVMAKTRVTPSKPTTVPRLELQAAVLGSRLATTICTELDIAIHEKIFSSDSTTVLQCIRAGPRLKQTYVRNRLGQINDATKITEWRWVPTLMNPADDATRASKKPMNSNDRWLVGPDFLREPPQTWPKEKALREAELREIDELESRKEFVGTVTACFVNAPLTRSKILGWLGLLAVAARLRKYTDRWECAVREIKGKESISRPKGSLHETKIEAEKFWYREIQSACFPRELDALRRGDALHKGSKIISLRPFIDEEGLLRAKGRVTTKFEWVEREEAKGMVRRLEKVTRVEFENEPIILDAQHFATQLLIAAYHRRYLHANNETVVNEMRQRFYIAGLRARLRWLSKRCIKCRLLRAQPQNPPMADLPNCRVAYGLRPFTHCGIDYFGPMWVKLGRRREKRWGVMLTCMTTRAIHVELAPSLNASLAIMAIQRLAGRRGMPRDIYSDNGTNFTKANKELRDAIEKLNKEQPQRLAKEKGFEWHFNPPDAPHMGGAWERQIRSVKTALDAALNEQTPSEEVLATLLIEIEHMVNSRPLTHVSTDPRDEEALTPNHFLIGSSSGHLELPRYEAEVLSPRRTFELVQNLAQGFWKRWLREYLPTLLPRRKWHASEPPLKVGDIVLIVDFQAPRNTWRKGRIVEVYPNRSDGVVRVVKVRAGKSELTRPVHKLVKICDTQ